MYSDDREFPWTVNKKDFIKIICTLNCTFLLILVELSLCKDSMSEEFDIIEIPFADLELSKTLEDEFLERRIATEIDQATDLVELKEAAKKLLQVTVARQAAIRGLCKRLVQYETMALQTYLNDETS